MIISQLLIQKKYHNHKTAATTFITVVFYAYYAILLSQYTNYSKYYLDINHFMHNYELSYYLTCGSV